MSLEDTDTATLRVWPNDLDLNIHMNNGRYLSIMDIGRMRVTVRLGLMKLMLKHKWSGVVGGANITFLKSLAPFQKYQLKTRVAGSYKGWVYMEQLFESNGKLGAVALVKVTFLKNGKRVMAQEVNKLLGFEQPIENPYLEELFKSEKKLLDNARQKYS